MKDFNPEAEVAPKVLVTDLDGTLIPLPKNEDNLRAIKVLNELHEAEKFGLVFATGRHFESVLEVIELYQLPMPDWIVCDVGSSIYKRTGKNFGHFETYEAHLLETTAGADRASIERLFDGIEGLKMQPAQNQRRFKISFECDGERLEELVDTVSDRLCCAKVPFHCVGSIDPFLHAGLLDVLPNDVSKAYALIWLATHGDFTPDEIVFCGDSGNDLAALISGFRAVIVANGSEGLEAKVRERLKSRGLEDRLYHAKSKATSGVLEGCRHFGLFKS